MDKNHEVEIELNIEKNPETEINLIDKTYSIPKPDDLITLTHQQLLHMLSNWAAITEYRLTAIEEAAREQLDIIEKLSAN